MRFVALISGGKDSIFAIMELLGQGHELVALAHLHPEQPG
jgi:diphthine-ammonia ligase